MRFCISVTGKDKTGIIAAITRLIYQTQGNLEDASMTILGCEFAMMVLVSFPNRTNLKRLFTGLHDLEQKQQLNITSKRLERSFKGGTQRGHGRKKPPYLISVFGKDRTGIVYRITQLLASKKLNIIDMNSKVIRSGKQLIYTLLIEVEIPNHFPVSALTARLKKLAKTLRVDLNLRSVEPLTL